MATTRDRKWNFAYRIEGGTVYIEDACHAQNMHESKNVTILTESKLRHLISECIRKILSQT